ncbi:MAG: MBOAT family protein [Ruminococcus sp.]|nr:MBOAT family protein [Ruminococcus sp.]
MIFSRLFFIYLFFPICFLCYFATKKTSYRNAVLIVFSLLFYACGEPTYLWLVIASAVLNYFLGRGISAFQDRVPAKLFLALGLIINLGVLVGFKYTAFAVENINSWFDLSLTVPSLDFPLGISFFTFRVVSYLIDCAWRKISAERNFFTFLLYESFFPITVSGPIVRYETMQNDLHERTVNAGDLSEGFTQIAIGLGKKVILADNLGTIVDQFLGNSLSNQTTLGIWYGVIVYAMQIYFDFAGYSDMAIGIARIFGFHLEENFCYPFLCKDITEFWQRWHISLGTFFRDYLLYVPIFGKRRKYGGLFLVWFCTGLWHGASWNYIIWGLYYGLFILIEMCIGKKRMKKIPAVVRHIFNKLIIVIGFGIFYCSDGISQLGELLWGLLGQNGIGWTDALLESSVRNNLFLLLASVLCCFPLLSLPKKLMQKNSVANLTLSIFSTVLAAAVFLISSVLLVDATNTPFLYTNF